jgi:Lrp/AsnC family leucine-responsive transcriptional regulator
MIKSAHTEIDNFDLAILRILQTDNTLPQKVIAEQINLSVASVHRRIKRMTDSGMIESNIAVLNPSKMGNPVTLFVEVELADERADLIDGLKKKFSENPSIQQCYYVTGEVDFILIIVTSSMKEYELLTRELFFSNSNIKRFRTFVVMDRIKAGLHLPLPG